MSNIQGSLSSGRSDSRTSAPSAMRKRVANSSSNGLRCPSPMPNIWRAARDRRESRPRSRREIPDTDRVSPRELDSHQIGGTIRVNRSRHRGAASVVRARSGCGFSISCSRTAPPTRSSTPCACAARSMRWRCSARCRSWCDATRSCARRSPRCPAVRVQVAQPAVPLEIPMIDLRHLSPERRRPELDHLLAREAARPLSLTSVPLMRAALVRMAEEEHVLSLAVHQIAYDAWSHRVLYAELAALYAAFHRDEPSPLAGPDLQYADFAVWQREQLSGATLARELTHWREVLDGAPYLLELPLDRPRPSVQRFHGGSLAFALDRELTATVNELAGRQGVSLFMTLLAGFEALLLPLLGAELVSGRHAGRQPRAGRAGGSGRLLLEHAGDARRYQPRRPPASSCCNRCALAHSLPLTIRTCRSSDSSRSWHRRGRPATSR